MLAEAKAGMHCQFCLVPDMSTLVLLVPQVAPKKLEKCLSSIIEIQEGLHV